MRYEAFEFNAGNTSTTACQHVNYSIQIIQSALWPVVARIAQRINKRGALLCPLQLWLAGSLEYLGIWVLSGAQAMDCEAWPRCWRSLALLSSVLRLEGNGFDKFWDRAKKHQTQKKSKKHKETGITEGERTQGRLLGSKDKQHAHFGIFGELLQILLH